MERGINARSSLAPLPVAAGAGYVVEGLHYSFMPYHLAASGAA